MIITLKAKFNAIKFTGLLSLLAVSLGLISGCERTPPDYRPMTTLAVYDEGDADRGSLIFEEACGQCHQLTPGLNKKGPQLMNIYGATAAQLADYNYSEGLKAKGWVWDAETLDPYIADAEKVVADSKMLADPMPDASERTDVIAYLSTLRAPIPALDEDGFPIDTASNRSTTGDTNSAEPSAATDKGEQVRPLRDEAIEVPEGAANKPAADFQ